MASRHRALIVGINKYENPANELRGCLNDAQQVAGLLPRLGFQSADDVRMVCDDRASADEVRARLRWLLADAGPEDVLFFHFSGHGGQIVDRDGDENSPQYGKVADNLDEFIVPWDFDWAKPETMILDDELHQLLIDANIPSTTSVTLLMDCCHSSTLLRSVVSLSAHPSARRCIPMPVDLEHRLLYQPPAGGRRRRRFGRCSVNGGAILIAGCRPEQTSADAYIGGAYHGAATYAFCKALTDNWPVDGPAPSPSQAVLRANGWLQANGYSQEMQAEGPDTELNLPFLSHA